MFGMTVKKILILVSVLLGLNFFISKIILPRTDGYAKAIEFVKENKRIQTCLGGLESVKPGLGLRFGMNSRFSHMSFSVHLKGEQRKGNLVLKMIKFSNDWKVSEAELSVEGSSNTVDLMR